MNLSDVSYKLLNTKERLSYFLKFDMDILLKSNLSSRTAAYTVGISNGYMTIAEVREKEDLPFITGMDKLLIPYDKHFIN